MTITTVKLCELHIGPEEDGQHEVGRRDTGVFIALPTEGVHLLRLLGDNLPVSQVRTRFGDTYGVEPELDDFIATLIELGFVTEVDGQPVTLEQDDSPQQPADAEQRGLALLAGLPQRRVAWLLSRPIKVVYAAIWIAVPAVMVAFPWLLPQPRDVIVIPRVLTNALIMAPIAWAMVLLHEAAHAIAVRAVGSTGYLSLSRRLWFLVAQTEMTGVRALPRGQRYAPYLAGITWDLALMLACLLLQLAGLEAPIIRAIVYVLTFSLIFQISVFMRTDGYFVITNVLRVGNLSRDTLRILRLAARRVARLGQDDDLADIPERERRIITWYIPLYLGGTAITAVLAGLLSIPAIILMMRLALDTLTQTSRLAPAWEGAAFLALTAAHMLAFAWVVLAERRQRRRQAASS